MSDVMQVRLHLSGVRVMRVGVDSVERLEVEVESAREWSRCRHCGFRCYRVWDRRAKRVRDLGVSGRRTTLVWRRRRFECSNCGERHLEDHARFQAGLTRRFADRLVADARVMSIRAVGRHHGVGWNRIMGLVRAHSAEVAQRRRTRPCRVLLVDETSIRRRHRYVTVVACGDSGQVLAMIPGRTKGSLARFFRDQGAWWCRQVEIVVSDGSRSYQAAIAQYLPDARHVLDRFHVVRWFTQGLTLVRREIQRRDPHRRPQRSSRTCSEPATSPKPTRHTSAGCSTLIPVSTPRGTLSKSSTSCIRPKTSIKPTRRSGGSPISTPPVRSPNTAKSWTRSSPGEWDCSTPDGPGRAADLPMPENPTSGYSGPPPNQHPSPTRHLTAAESRQISAAAVCRGRSGLLLGDILRSQPFVKPGPVGMGTYYV